MTNYNLKERIMRTYQWQYRFAKAVGVDESLVSKVISGAKTINRQKQEAWAKKLNSPVDFLFADTDEE